MTWHHLEVVSERLAFALAGPGAQEGSICGFDYAQGVDGCVIVVEPHDDPGRSGVWNPQTFRVVGPVPEGVRVVWLRASHSRPPIHVFVRFGADFVYLGTASPCWFAHAVSEPDDTFELTECLLRLSQPVPADMLERVRPTTLPTQLPGVAWLGRLADDRVAALREFLTGWYPDLQPEERPFGLSLAHLPPVLAEFHRLTYRMRVDQNPPTENHSTGEFDRTRHGRNLNRGYRAGCSRRSRSTSPMTIAGRSRSPTS
ncbi:hypothetical protein AB0M36_37550 [Actinoplanes sp. NPDC051346]|uniref:hypothetical protein n=1 Tax=Actinoplanes sp. NPDC051346 TaxID=3155048 RepID=UPI003416F8C1